MVAPFLVAGGLMAGAYHVGRAFENERYWRDYKNRYHVSVRYPYRSGRNDTFRYFARAVGGLGFASVPRPPVLKSQRNFSYRSWSYYPEYYHWSGY